MSARDDLRDQQQQDDAGRDVRSTRASDIPRRPVQWLWRGWVPLKMISLNIGAPGCGKSTTGYELAARTTRGELDGDLLGQPSDVAVLTYEDALSEVARPRLEAASADLDHVHFLHCRDPYRPLDLTSQLGEVERIAKAHSVRLLVVDPLMASMSSGKVDSYRDSDVRSKLMAPLAAVAERCELAVVATGHFSKSATSALLGAGGSVGFVAAARSILVFGVDPRDEQGARGPARVVAHAKCNVGPLQQSLEVKVVADVLDPFGEGPDANVVTTRASIEGPCDVSADDLIQGERKVNARAEAMKFLRQLLADGPHLAKEVHDLAADAGIAKNTLERAKKDLGVDSYQRDRRWWWLLPEEPPEEPETGEEEEAEW